MGALTKYSRSLLDIKLKHVIMNKSADIPLNCHAQIQRGEGGGLQGSYSFKSSESTILFQVWYKASFKWPLIYVSNG